MIKLRAYQEKQLAFLRDVNGLVKGLQSPTGTGKSIVFLSYVKECLEQDKYKTVVITTGFNELVFQMAEDAKLFGLEPRVIIGSGHLIPNCVPETNVAPKFGFSKSFVGACTDCDPEGPKRMRAGNKCSKKCIMNFLRSGGKKFIITNHSYFLTMKDFIDADLVIVDEAHTFGDFYMSHNTISLSKKENELLSDYCNYTVTPTSQVLKMALNKGIGINAALLGNVIAEIKAYYGGTDVEIGEFARKLEIIFTQKAFDNYLEEVNGEYIKTKFFSRFDLSSKDGDHVPDIIISSATLDKYTLKMFSCENKNQIYIQKEDRNRYKGSKILSYYAKYADAFVPAYESILEQEESEEGLILCTSNENVRLTVSMIQEHFPQVAVFTSSVKFKAWQGRKVLVGSKKFYQGIDIPGLQYVILDRIPFSVYDEKFQRYSYYIEKVMNEDAWTGYSVPLMYNTLLQGIGRLWRKNDIENGIYDQGIVAIFDPRLESKFSYVETNIAAMKPGIAVERYKLIGGKLTPVRKEFKTAKRGRGKIVVEVTPEEFEQMYEDEVAFEDPS